jgi:hypothetical protein
MEAVPATEEVDALHFTAVTTFKRNPHVYSKEVRALSLPLSLSLSLSHTNIHSLTHVYSKEVLSVFLSLCLSLAHTY